MAGRSASVQQPTMIVSDLDGTLLGDHDATGRFQQWWRVNGLNCRLVYATGRHYASAVASIRDAGMPEPDAIVADVGTDLRFAPFSEPFTEWPETWWGKWSVEDAQHALAGLPGVEFQPIECQSKYKRSYFLKDASIRLLDQIRRRLAQNSVSAEVIYSSNRDLDIIPLGASKGAAAAYLAARWEVPRSRVLVAGDSGNDRSLFLHGFRGIVVGNAQPELARLCRPDVHHATRTFADGVIEGLDFWLRRGSQSDRRMMNSGTSESRVIGRMSG